jgi:hypothetical protein
MMAIERQGRSIAINVFMASARMLCGRSNAVWALEHCAGARLMKTGSKKNYNRLHELMIQTKR